MRPWYERDPARWARELEAVQASGLRLSLHRGESGLVGWRGTVEVLGVDRLVTIWYPEWYPSNPPWLWETDSDDVPLDARETHHQLVNGALCLHGAAEEHNAWAADHTVVDVVERYRVFRQMADDEEHLNDHGGPTADFTGQSTECPLLLSPEQTTILRSPGWGWIRTRPLAGGNAWVAEHVATGDGGLQVGQDIRRWPVATRFAPPEIVPWVKVSAPSWRTSFPDGASVQAALPPEAPRHPLDRVVLVRHLRCGRIDARWVQPLPTLAGERLLTGPLQEMKLESALFARVDGVLASRATLDDWTAVLVGLGSLGGSVAVHLARSGVRRFVLYDPDLLRPENVLRHAAGRVHLYRPKVDAVRELILDRNPWAEVAVHRSSPLWDHTPGASADFDALLRQDRTLVVVTTAEHEVERTINARAVRHGRPVIYGSVLGHADHGRVFRVLPGESPCYECVVDGQLEAPGRFFRAEGEAMGTAGYAQPGIPGLGLDVEMVALLTARLALQTLGRLGSGALGYTDAPGHHLVWTNRGGHGFDLALQVRWERYARRPACPACSLGTPDEDPDLSTHIRHLERTLSDLTRMAPQVPLVRGPPQESTP